MPAEAGVKDAIAVAARNDMAVATNHLPPLPCGAAGYEQPDVIHVVVPEEPSRSTTGKTQRHLVETWSTDRRRRSDG